MEDAMKMTIVNDYFFKPDGDVVVVQGIVLRFEPERQLNFRHVCLEIR